ncbi:MAG: helix-turn-helix domain containing protein [Nitrospira sp.]|nr:helix-turn-helix domain containing protein [Nitrospira sp.]
MTNREQLIKARLAILTMAAELNNVVKVCKLAGVSRSHFYAMKKAYETQGKEGLAPRVRRKPLMPNRTPEWLEGHILAKTQENPTVSYVRLAGQLQGSGVAVTPAMVRYVWQREGLSTRHARLHWVKVKVRQACVQREFGRDDGDHSDSSSAARHCAAGAIGHDGASPL